MELHVFKDAEALSNAVAKWIADIITETLKKKDRFTIALSGGSTPERLHKILAASPYKEQIDWTRMHIFWGDERAVPFEDSRNNAKMAYDTLLNFVPVPADQIHVMRTDISPEQSALEYEKILHQYFGETGASFDLGRGRFRLLSIFPMYHPSNESKRKQMACVDFDSQL